MIDVVGVLAVEFVLEVIVAGGQTLLLGRIGGFGDVGRHLQGLLLEGHQVGQGAAGLVVQGAVGVEARLLFQVAEMGRRMDLARAGVGLVLAGQDPQQRGLAAAVGSDQADAVARPHLERNAIEHRFGAETFPYIDDV